MGQLDTLLVIADARALVGLEGNDFSWAGWEDADEARRELDACAREVARGRRPGLLQVLFLPTGPLQELSLSSGWGDAYVELAARCDRALGQEDCSCLEPPFSFDAFTRTPVGTDPEGGRFAEITLEVCTTCGRRFLRYAFEVEGFTGSGRWIRAPLPLRHPHPSPSNALRVLSLAPFHWVGGSYYESTGSLQRDRFDPDSL